MSEQQEEIIQNDLIDQDEMVDELQPPDELIEVAPNKFVTKDYAEANNIQVGEEKKEVSEEGKVEDVKTEDVKAEKAVEEKPIVEAKEVVEDKVEPIEQPKAIDPYEALEFTEEGQKEYLKKIVDAIKTNTLPQLIENMSVNYDRMNEHQLLEYEISNKIKSEYPSISDKALNAAVQKEKDKVLAEYDVYSDDEEQAEVGMELFKLRMDKVREGFKQTQAEFQPPKYEPKVAELDPQIAEQHKLAEKARTEFVAKIEASQIIQEVERTKAVSFGDVKIDVPDSFNAKEQTINVNAFLSTFFDANGNFDDNRWTKTIAFGADPDKAAQTFINHGKSVKEKENFESLRGLKNKELDAMPNSDADNPYKIGRMRHTGQN